MIALKRVDLPDPFIPMRPVTRPGSTETVTSDKATTSP